MKNLALQSAVLVMSIMAVNAANYGLNILLANTLEPSQFGDASLLVTILLITGVLAATIQLSTSVALLKTPDERDGHLRSMRLLTNRLGWAGGLVLAVASPFAADALQVQSPWALVVMAAGFPLHLQLAVERGRLQGDLRLGRLAATFLVEGIVRTAATLAIVAVAPGIVALAIALNLAFIGGYLVCRPHTGALSWLDVSPPNGHPPIGAVGVSVVAVTLITNIDIVAAKAVFEPAVAGEFAVLCLGGRIVFFASWTLQQALLPLVVAERSPISASVRRRAFLAGNAALCGALVAVAWIWSDLWIDLAFADSYVGVASYFGPYAFGTGLIAVAASVAVIASTRGNDRPGMLLLTGAVAMVAVLLTIGDTLDSFVDLRLGALVAMTVAVAFSADLSGRFSQRPTDPCRSVREGAMS